MVLNQKQTTIAYRCPVCGMGVVSMVGVFALSGDMLKLKCTCGESELIIVYTKDKKLRLTVPCIICPKPHGFTVSSSVFFGKDIFTLPCPLSGIDICFIGKPEQVEKAMNESEKELIAMLTEAGLDDFNSFDEDGTPDEEDEKDAAAIGQANLNALRKHTSPNEISFDPQLLETVMFVIRDLHDEGKISCGCGIGCGDYSVNISEDGEKVIVSCDKCGAKVEIPAASTLAVNQFVHTDFLELK